MKKTLLLALAITVTSLSFATDENKVNYKAKAAFSNQYADAKNVDWKIKNNYIKVEFKQDNKLMQVFYDFDGNQVGVSTMVNFDKLPAEAKKTIAKKYAYPKYNVKDCLYYEDTASGEANYFVRLQKNGKNKFVVLKIDEKGSISIF